MIKIGFLTYKEKEEIIKMTDEDPEWIKIKEKYNSEIKRLRAMMEKERSAALLRNQIKFMQSKNTKD